MKGKRRLRVIALVLAICTVLLPYNMTFAKEYNNDIKVEDYKDKAIDEMNFNSRDDKLIDRSSYGQKIITAGTVDYVEVSLGSFVLWRDFVVNTTTDDNSTASLQMSLYDPNNTLKFQWYQTCNEMTAREVWWLPAGTWKLYVDATNATSDVRVVAIWRD